MANEPQSSDPYDAVVADIDAKIAQLQQAKAAILAVRSGQTIQNQASDTGSGQAQPSTITPGMFHGMSIVEAVKQLLSIRKKALGTAEITEEIIAGGVVFSTDTPGNTVGSVLHRESVKPSGGIISVARGTWALPAWYSNPGRFRKKGEKTEDEVATEEAPKVGTGWGTPPASEKKD